MSASRGMISELRMAQIVAVTRLGVPRTVMGNCTHEPCTLGGLAGLTGTSGTYTLTLTAAGSGIRDGVENPLAGDASDAWAANMEVLTADAWYSAAEHGGGVGEALLGIPDEVKFVIATPLAYPAQGSYDRAARERLGQRTRKDRQEVAFSNQWGKPF